jgi:hypothetical protein
VADAGAGRIDVGVVAEDRDFAARASFAGDILNNDGSVIDFVNFFFEDAS